MAEESYFERKRREREEMASERVTSRQFVEPYAGTAPSAEPEVDDSSSWLDTGQAVTNELTKSYGLRYENGSWSWSLENVGKSFKEDPIWTTIDYMLLAMPVAKWGAAAYKVSKGTGAAGRVYKAGTTTHLFGEASTLGGKAVEKVGRSFGAAPGLGRAAELERDFGVAQTRVGEAMSSYVARKADDPEWQALVDAAGGRDPFEMRAWGSMLDRERRAAAAAEATEAQNLTKRWRANGADWHTDPGKARSKVVFEAMEKGMSRADAEHLGVVGADAGELYEKSIGFVFKTHERANQAGWLSDEAYEAGLKGYMPRMYEELQRYKSAFADAARKQSGPTAAGTTEHLAKRKLTRGAVADLENQGVLTRILDPGLGIMEVGKVAMRLAGHDYAKKLAASAAVRSADEVLDSVDVLFRGGANDALSAARRGQYSEAKVRSFTERLDLYKAIDVQKGGPGTLANIPEELKGSLLRDLGWKPLDEIFGGKDMPAHLKGAAEEFAGRWVDPAVADDVTGIGHFIGQFEHAAPAISKLYNQYVATFKYTHTVQNPSTQVRNLMGAGLFHHLNVGGMGILNPKNPLFRAGRRALNVADGKHLDDAQAVQDYKDVMRGAHVGTAHSAELKADFEKAFDIDPSAEGIGQALFYKLLGAVGVNPNKSRVAATVAKGMTKMEETYRYVDDMAKADAFITRRDHWIKQLAGEQAELRAAGKTSRLTRATKDELREIALDRASADVAKFQPVFSQVSPFTNMVRGAVPFASFTTEAVRVWKNAIIEKPHLAFFWNHAIESLSEVMGGVAGFTPEDVDNAYASLPHYQKGKKMQLLPFRVDGKPAFIDFSYMIPMANIVEAQSAEATFFDYIGINPVQSNPVAALATAAATGIDPFSGREVEPTFTERQLGVPMEPGQARKAVGLAEYVARTLVPPLVPPGFAGVNLLEWARGQRHPMTGAELEQGLGRTLAANLTGFRVYEGDVNSQLLNIKREQRLVDGKLDTWWDKWRSSAANGDATGMDRAVKEISALRALRGDDEAGVAKYVANGIKTREPGKFRTLSTKEIKETLARSERLGALNEDDLAMRAELMARLQERSNRGRKPKKKTETVGVGERGPNAGQAGS